MATQHVNPSGVGAPSNYTHVVASSGGSIVFISGQIGMDAAGKIAGDTLEAQGDAGVREPQDLSGISRRDV